MHTKQIYTHKTDKANMLKQTVWAYWLQNIYIIILKTPDIVSIEFNQKIDRNLFHNEYHLIRYISLGVPRFSFTRYTCIIKSKLFKSKHSYFKFLCVCNERYSRIIFSDVADIWRWLQISHVVRLGHAVIDWRHEYFKSRFYTASRKSGFGISIPCLLNCVDNRWG